MILGYSSNAFKKHTIYEAVEKVAGLGFRGIEIMCKPPHVHPSNFGEEEWSRRKASIEERSLRVINLNCPTLFAAGDGYGMDTVESPEQVDAALIGHTLQCLRLASYLGCRNISIPTAMPPKNLARKGFVSLFHRRLEQLIPLAEELKVLLPPREICRRRVSVRCQAYNCMASILRQTAWERALKRLLKKSHLRRSASSLVIQRTGSTPHSSGFCLPCIWNFLNSLLQPVFQRLLSLSPFNLSVRADETSSL